MVDSAGGGWRPDGCAAGVGLGIGSARKADRRVLKHSRLPSPGIAESPTVQGEARPAHAADSAIMRTARTLLEARKKARRLASSRRSAPQDQLDRKIACGRSRRRSPGASQVTAKPQKAVPAGQHTLVSPLPVRTHRPRRAPANGLEAVAAQTRDATRMVRRPDE